MASFAQRLETIQLERQSNLALLIAPCLNKLPLIIQAYDDPFFPYARAIINATRNRVCAYLFDLAAYLSLGAAGAVALERSIAYTKEEVLSILHGPFAEAAYLTLLNETSFNADAVTLVNQPDMIACITQADRTAFVMRHGEPQHREMSQCSIYWQDAGLLTLPTSNGILQVRLAGEDILYAGITDDFAQQTAAALEKMR